MIDNVRDNIDAMLKLMDKEGGPEVSWPLMQKGIENEYCLREGKVILDCFMKVKKQKEEEKSAA